MKYFFIVLVIFIFLFRKMLTRLIIVLFKKIKNVKNTEEEEEENPGRASYTVFSPVGVVRYIDVTLEITEIGNGKTTIQVIKKAKKVVKSEE